MLTGVRPPFCSPVVRSAGELVCVPEQQGTSIAPPQRGIAPSLGEPAPSAPAVRLDPKPHDADNDAGPFDTLLQSLGSGPSWAVIVIMALALLVLILLLALLQEKRGKHAPAGDAPAGLPAASKQEQQEYRNLVSGLIGAYDLSGSDVVRAHVEKSLRGVGIRIISPISGQPFDTAIHNGVTGIPSPDPALVFHIARVLRPGWQSPDGILRPADVEVFKE